jgi:hypothetical protein
MPANTVTIGYPVHAVATFSQWENRFGAKGLKWTAQCGASDTQMGGFGFGRAGSARSRELCPKCFPGQDYNRCKLDPPQDLTDQI